MKSTFNDCNWPNICLSLVEVKAKFTYRIIALCMALLTQIAGMSAAISIHFCGDEPIAISLFGEAEGCEMSVQQQVLSCCDSQNTNQTPAFGNLPCCSTEVNFHEIDGDPTQALVDWVETAVQNILFLSKSSTTSTVVAPVIADNPAPPLSYNRIQVTQSFLC